MRYTDMDVARAIIKEAEKIFDLASSLTDDNDMIPSPVTSKRAYSTWTELVELRCQLEELRYLDPDLDPDWREPLPQFGP
jgi:hypothetical protein